MSTAPTSPTHYDTLEVSPRASPEVIRAAYKSLMQRYHPDKQGNDREAGKIATLKATQIAQAYEVLSTADKREAYDQRLRSAALAQNAKPTNAPPMPTPTKGSSWPGVKPSKSSNPSKPGKTNRAVSAAGGHFWAWAALVLTAVVLITVSAMARKAYLRAKAPSAPVVAQAVASETTASASLQDPSASKDRFFPRFTTQIKVDLVNAPKTAEGITRTLAVEEITLLVFSPNAAKWASRLEERNGAVMKAIEANLAGADYGKLLERGGDLYVGELISKAIWRVIDVEAPEPGTAAATPSPPAAADLASAPAPIAASVPTPASTPPARLPFAVQLPQSYSVR